MVINKIFGALFFIAGVYLLLALWYTKEGDYEMFTIEVIGSTLLIYAGLKLMNFF